MPDKAKLDQTSNEELARRLFRSEPIKPAAPARPAPAAARPATLDPSPGLQPRFLGSTPPLEGGISERERQALFAALRKGTRANVGRDPAVAELVRLVEELLRARALVAAAEDAMAGSLGIHLESGAIVFRGPTSERLRSRLLAAEDVRQIRTV